MHKLVVRKTGFLAPYCAVNRSLRYMPILVKWSAKGRWAFRRFAVRHVPISNRGEFGTIEEFVCIIYLYPGESSSL